MPATASASSRFEAGILARINQVRAGNGLRALHASGALRRAAFRQCVEQARRGVLTHDSAAGSPYQRLASSSRKRVGETIAFVSRRSAARVLSMWMNSPPHRAVLLDGGFRTVGIAVRRTRLGGARGLLVTADFAG